MTYSFGPSIGVKKKKKKKKNWLALFSPVQQRPHAVPPAAMCCQELGTPDVMQLKQPAHHRFRMGRPNDDRRRAIVSSHKRLSREAFPPGRKRFSLCAKAPPVPVSRPLALSSHSLFFHLYLSLAFATSTTTTFASGNYTEVPIAVCQWSDGRWLARVGGGAWHEQRQAEPKKPAQIRSVPAQSPLFDNEKNKSESSLR